MAKKLTLLSLCAVMSLGALAAPISPDMALARIKSNGPARARSASDMTLAHTVKTHDGKAAAYVFTPANGVGFTIASANDIAVPVLGYSDSSVFDAGSMPVQLVSWLDAMARRVEFLESQGVDTRSDAPYAPENWTPIAPLCKTVWNQDAPYNKETPVINGVQSPTGCVATSFAQVMYYFKYPERGEGTISYTNNGKSLRLNLAAKAIKWDNMLEKYTTGNYTDAQADAVAYLMKACGYSVQMGYGQYSSGAQSYRLVNALVDNFKYDEGITYEDRLYYSTSQWAELIYNNIKNVGPVIYDGAALEGGHSFICDGYSGDGYFHFNWGWGGLSDGYYVLDVLNPESQGTGGAVGGFNWSQDAVIGIQKPTGGEHAPRYAQMVQYGNTLATINSSKLVDWQVNDYGQLGWGPGNYVNASVDVAGEIVNLADNSVVAYAEGGMGTLGNTAYLNVGYWLPLTNTHPVMQLPSGLQDGTYKITLVTRDPNYENAPWLPVLIAYGYSNYTMLKVENGNYSIVNQPAKTLTFQDMYFVNNLYQGKNTMMKGKVVNNTDLDLTVCIQPVLVKNGKQQFAGDMMLVSASPNQTVEDEWIVCFYQLENSDAFVPGTKYTLQIIDKSSGKVLGTFGEVEMNTVSGKLAVNVLKFDIEGASQESVTVGSRTFKNTYMVTGDEPVLNFDYEVTNGYFDGALQIGMQWYNPETLAYERLEGDLVSYHPFLAKGQGDELAIPLDITNLSKSGVYNVVASSVSGGQNTRLGSMTFAFSQSGVQSIFGEDAGDEAVYFNLQGARVDNPQKGDVLIKVQGSTAEKIIIK